MFVLNGCGGGSGGGTGAAPTPTPTPGVAVPVITAFSINGSAGVISGNRIAVTVPFGTNVTALTTKFTAPGSVVSVGGVPQVSGVTTNNFTGPVVYTVTKIGTSASASVEASSSSSTTTYTVTVTVAPISAKAITAFSLGATSLTSVTPGIISILNIAVTMPFGTNVKALVATFTTSGASVAVNGVNQVNGVTQNDFTNPVTYTVTAADGTTQNYIVTVTVASASANDILAFSLNGTPGVISSGGLTQTIVVKVPNGTNVNGLVASFITTGVSVVINGVLQVSGTTQNDFTGPVTYIVTSANGTTQTYTVTVIVSSTTSNFINAYSFGNISGVITGQNIAVIVPSGTDVTALITSFITTGVNVTVGGVTQTSTATPNDFTSPVIYTVIAADGSSSSYTITVTVAHRTAKAITAFSFGSTAGVITGQNIAITMPFGTDVTGLIATFSTTGVKVTVNGVNQISSSTINNYTNPVSYVVTADDGSTATYLVAVSVASNSAKAITAFGVAGVSGTINGFNIAVIIPFATNTTALVATFTTTGTNVSIGGVTQFSGTTINNFTSPVTYVVTAADGSTATYLVTVSTSGWISQVGASGGHTKGQGIILDNIGNSYITGLTDVGLSGQVQQGNFDYFIAKYNGSGVLQWTRQVGASGGDTEGNGISVDGSGNSYITGFTNVAISGQTKPGGGQDYFIAKYNSSGVLQWTRLVGAGGDTEATGISVDSGGNSYITGFTSVSISGQTLIGTYGYFVAKYDTSGALLWTVLVGAIGGNINGLGISVDSSGNSYITGTTNVALPGQIKQGNKDYFIVKYNSSGVLQWTRQVGASGGTSLGWGVSVDASGNSYIAGDTNVALSGQALIGIQDYFIAKYDISGTLQWTREVGVSGWQVHAAGISADTNGNSFITGYTPVGISGQTLIGIQDYYIARYNNSGTLQVTREFGASGGTASGAGISVDNNGNSNVTGNTNVGLYGQSLQGVTDYFINSVILP